MLHSRYTNWAPKNRKPARTPFLVGLIVGILDFPWWRLLVLGVSFSGGLLLGQQTLSQEVGFSGLTNPFLREGRSGFVIRTWGQADGLPRNSVHSIAQTPDGFLWLGTSAGLARFDGMQFKVFSPYTTSAVPVGTIKTLLVDSHGCLWIGSLEGGIAKMQNGTLSEVDVSQVNAYAILHLAEDREGRIWVGADGGLFYIENEVLKSDPTKTGPPGRSSTVGIDSNSGGLYTCYWEFLVLWRDEGHVPVYAVNSSGRLMSQSIYPRKDGGLWFLSSSAADNGLLARLLEPGSATSLQKWPFEIPQYGVGAFLEDSRRNLWISVLGSGVYRVAPDGEYELFEIGNGRIVALFEDDVGSIWAGSSVSGLTRLKQGLFQNVTGSASGSVGAVSEEVSGKIVFSKGDRLYRFNRGGLEEFGGGGVMSAFADRAGFYWIAIPGSLGRYEWDEKSKLPRVLAEDKPAQQICCFYQTTDGQMWFGSAYGGLVTSDGDRVRVLPETLGDAICSLTEGPDGTLWAGTTKGDLWYVREGQSTRVELDGQLDHRRIRALHFDDEGVLWLGTIGMGLVVQKGNEFVATRQADGLPSDEVNGIVGVGAHLWLATTGGIARVNRDEVFERSSTSGNLSDCLVFGPDDGLLDSACSSAYSPSMHRAKDGRLWVSMIENVVSLDPEEVSKGIRNRSVYIEEVRVDDEVVGPLEDGLRIPPGPARLSFTYTTVALEAPERTRFQYRLEGLDADWIDSWGQRTAGYNSPPPGRYQFHVRATNSRGEWGEGVRTLRLTIEPYFWQTLPFKIASVTLIGILFGAIVWLVARVKLSRKLGVLERDHAVEKERARIASEIHDKLGAQLTQILFQSQSLTGRLEVEADGQGAQQASKVNSSAQELARGLDEVVWATNPEMDTLEGLVAYLSSYAEEFFRYTPIRLRFDVPISLETRGMASEVRHNLFLSASEAMTNLLKHAEASEATIGMQLTENDFVVEISDNGKGFAAEPSRRLGNGLRNMTERMRQIGGSAEFVAREPSGLVVRLSVVIPPEAVSPKKGILSENGPVVG